MTANTYSVRNVAVTTTKKSQAAIPWAWLRTKVSQRCFGSGVRAGPPQREYLPTSGAIPEGRASATIHWKFVPLPMSHSQLPSLGSGGASPLASAVFRRDRFPSPKQTECCPVPTDERVRFHVPQRIAPGDIRLRVAIIHRVESTALRGLTFRS